MPFTSFTVSQAQTLAYLQALNPALTQAPTSVVVSLINTVTALDALTNIGIAAAAQDITYTTASGAALVTKAQDYNVIPPAGLPATAYVVFYTQIATPDTLTLSAGTVVSTAGDGVTVPQVQFVTQETAIIPSGSTDCGTPILVLCTQNGVVGNVSAGSLTQCALTAGTGILCSNALSVGWPGNHQVTNTQGAGVGGLDPAQDPQIRALIAAEAAPGAGIEALTNAILAVAGVVDAYVIDPQAGTGYCYYYWCDALGANGTVTGGTATATGAPDNTTYIAGATLSGLAASVDAAVRATLPIGIVPRVGTTIAAGNAASTLFSVVEVTAVSLTWAAPPGVQASAVDPLIQSAVAAYLSGGTVNTITTPGLQHNEVPTIFGLSEYVQQVVGGILTNLTITAATPSTTFTATPSPTTVYRASPSLVVTTTP